MTFSGGSTELGAYGEVINGKEKATRYNEKADANSEQFNKKCR